MAPASPAARPRLIIVRGKPGAGKTTLARRLAESDALGLPVLSRDAIKVGMVQTFGIETEAVRGRVIPHAFDLFHRTIELWLREGVSLIADEAFSRQRAEEALRALATKAEMLVLHCDTADREAKRRYLQRESSNLHTVADTLAETVRQMEGDSYPWRIFDAFDLGVPALHVDTTDGYDPRLEEIVSFCSLKR